MGRRKGARLSSKDKVEVPIPLLNLYISLKHTDKQTKVLEVEHLHLIQSCEMIKACQYRKWLMRRKIQSVETWLLSLPCRIKTLKEQSEVRGSQLLQSLHTASRDLKKLISFLQRKLSDVRVYHSLSILTKSTAKIEIAKIYWDS